MARVLYDRALFWGDTLDCTAVRARLRWLLIGALIVGSSGAVRVLAQAEVPASPAASTAQADASANATAPMPSPAPNPAPAPAVESAVPADYAPLIEQAIVASASGDWAAARSAFARAHAIYPNAQTLRGLGSAELEIGDPARAASLLENALASTQNPLSGVLRADTQEKLALARRRAASTAPASSALPPPPAAATMPTPAAPQSVRTDAPAPIPDVDFAGLLRLSSVVPLQGYAERTNGFALSGSMWVRTGHLVVEPQLTIEFDVEDEHRGYVHIAPIDLGAYYYLPFDEHALFVGPGVGLHMVFERVDVDRSYGSVIKTRTKDTLEDNTLAFGTYARIGLVLLSRGPVSLVPSVDYAVTFARVQNSDREQAIRGNLAVMFGGGR